MTYGNTAFLTTPVFTLGTVNEEEENPVLPPSSEVEIQQPPSPPPDGMDGTVASGITTMAAE